MSTIPQNTELLKHLFVLLQAHRPIFQQERAHQRVVALMLAEMFVFTRHTVTQLLLSLGQNEADWSSWYRLCFTRLDARRQIGGLPTRLTTPMIRDCDLTDRPAPRQRLNIEADEPLFSCV